MRIRVIRKPPADGVDGIDLRRFHVGAAYTVGNTIGGLALAEGWAVPLAPGELDTLVPLDVLLDGVARRDPPNLIRERGRELPFHPRASAAERQTRQETKKQKR